MPSRPSSPSPSRPPSSSPLYILFASASFCNFFSISSFWPRSTPTSSLRLWISRLFSPPSWTSLSFSAPKFLFVHLIDSRYSLYSIPKNYSLYGIFLMGCRTSTSPQLFRLRQYLWNCPSPPRFSFNEFSRIYFSSTNFYILFYRC